MLMAGVAPEELRMCLRQNLLATAAVPMPNAVLGGGVPCFGALQLSSAPRVSHGAFPRLKSSRFKALERKPAISAQGGLCVCACGVMGWVIWGKGVVNIPVMVAN